MTIVRISDDALALACGADAVAAAFEAAGCTVERVSSWGMHWLEPLVEVDGVGFGPVAVADVLKILPGTGRGTATRSGGVEGHGPHRATSPGQPIVPVPLHHPADGSPPRSGEDLCIGTIAAHPFIADQQRLTFARAGKTRPLSLDDYAATGGWAGLTRARSLSPEQVVAEVVQSGLRGRGGAGFPAGIKWQTVAAAPGPRKYIVCNADEGDSGTFADRMLMEGDPFALIEGMAIAAHAVGAGQGYIYVRSEYPHAIAKLKAALALTESLISPFRLEVRAGAGAYVCGEETALLNSLEGKRGEVRAKPPLPALEGLFGCPTVVNNVLTLAAVPHILSEGGAALYEGLGIARSKGTMPIQLAGNIRHGGLFETAFGITLRELIYDIGGGTASGRPVKAVQVGGPLGAYIHPDQFDLPFDYEAYAATDALIGHGGVVVFDDTVDMAKQARFAMEFCAIESCGKCTPCRIGSARGVELVDKIVAGEDTAANLLVLEDLCNTMKFGSLCALGGFTPYPVMSALTHFPEDFGARKRLQAAE